MAGITLTQAQDKLTFWLAQEEKAALKMEKIGSSVSDREVARQNLNEIASRVSYWDNKVKVLTRKGISVASVTPV